MTENITDKKQRDTALDPTRSFIVQAPAGSGKTSLLIQRFLALLEHVQKPEEILAITFTRKAADEMRTRITAVLDKDINLSIYTIDGFCNSITRQMPITSGFGVQPEIIEGVDATICYKQAVATLVSNLGTNVPLQDLLLHLDNNYQKLENLLVNMLAKRDQWLPHFKRKDILASLQNLIQDNIDNCRNNFPVDLLQELCNLVEVDERDELTKWQSIASLLLTKDYKWRKKFNKLPIYNNDELLLNLKTILLTPINYSKEQRQLIENIIIILKQLAAELWLVFRDKAAVDYIEIALAAERGLGTDNNPTDLALKLDYKIQHILVDEFQDTSTSQYRLLEKITAGWQTDDGRTLFLVGDPMQSIYKFREAKVGLFLKAKNEGINNIKLHSLTLSTNFRSEKHIIDWINQVFPKVMPTTQNIATGAIPFIPTTAVHTSNNKQVHLYNTDNEAQQVVNIIKSHKNGTTAILVRSRSHLIDILPALQAAKLNYKAVELETLNENPLIQDLFALTRAIVNPLDRIAWLAIIRAPWCGLNLKDLYILANDNHDKPLWDSIINYQQFDLSTDAKRRLQVLIDAMQHKQVEDTWIALNGPAYTTELQHAKTFFELLRSIDLEPDQMPVLEEKLTTLYAEPDPNADDSLQIMTMHRAKGLEFDTVIIPKLNASPKRNEDPLLMWTEHSTDDLILAPIKASGTDHDPIYRYLQFEDKIKNQYETGRLLYVAITRAKKNLYLLANVNNKPNPGSLLAQLWPLEFKCYTD